MIEDPRVTQVYIGEELMKGRTVAGVAASLRVSRTYVYKVARRFKFPLNKPVSIPSGKARRIYDAVTPAMPPSMVARVFRIHVSVVNKVIAYYKGTPQ